MSGEQGGEGGNDGRQPPLEIVEFMNQTARRRAESGTAAADDAATTQGPDAAAQDENPLSGITTDMAQQDTSIENDAPSSDPRVSGEAETTVTTRQPTNLYQNASDLADLRPSDPDSHEEPQGLRDELEPVEVTTEEVEAAAQNGLREWGAQPL